MSEGPATSDRVVAGRYRLVRQLGTGAHGVVDLAEDLLRGDSPVAVKRIEGIFGAGEPDPAAERLRWFLHPRWAEILDEGRYGDHGRFQVTRFIPGESLEELDGPRPVEEIWKFLEDGARVLRAIHALGLIHYDVTPGNWIREATPDGPVFTLTDGGLANLGPVRGIARGTPLYMAPELTENRTHDHRVDLYSLGLVAWRLATGKTPWEGGAGEVLGARRRERCPSARELRPDLPAALDAVLAELLEREPVQRPLDALALLKRLEEARGAPIPVLLPEEGIAAASGGPLVGRDDIVARFRRSCRLIASTDSVPSATASLVAAARHGADSTPDPVLLVYGPSGSGATRLLREFAAVARTADVACLSLAGLPHDGTALLNRLFEAVERSAPPDLDVSNASRAFRDSTADTSTGASATLPIESLVRLVTTVASRVSLVLLVEDFGLMPPIMQSALQVLSREIVSRSEHPAGRPPLRIVLAIDLGDGDPQQFLLTDAADPTRSLLQLQRLQEPELVALIGGRFPGAALPALDARSFLQQVDGLPVRALSFLSEAIRQRVLHPSDRGWELQAARLSDCRPSSTLAPALAFELAQAPEELRLLLDLLALLDEPLPTATCNRLIGANVPPHSPLLLYTPKGAVAPASRALREVLRARLTSERATELQDAMISALADCGCAYLALERARLLSERARPVEALRELLRALDFSLTSELGIRAQRVALLAVRAAPACLDDPGVRAGLVQLLRISAEGIELAETLAQHTGGTASTDRHLVDFLLTARRYDLVRTVADRLLEGCNDPSSVDRAYVALARARATVADNGRCGTSPLPLALSLRRLGRLTRRSQPALSVTYLLFRGQVDNLESRQSRSASAFRRAYRKANAHGLRLFGAQALNNLAVTKLQQGDLRAACRLLQSSHRAKLRLGDLGGAANTLHNLALLHLDAGKPLQAASVCSDSAAFCIRYGLSDAAARALQHLAAIYDRQQNAGLAIRCLERTLALSTTAGLVARRAHCDRQLAPLYAATGRLTDARASLLRSARLARKVRSQRSDHFLASFQAFLHAGHPVPQRARLELARRQAGPQGLLDGDLLAVLLDIQEAAQAPHTFNGPRARPKTPEQRAHQYLLAAARFSRPENALRKSLRALLSRDGPPAWPIAAGHVRLLLEALLTSAQQRGLADTDALATLELLDALADRQGFATLVARVAALRFLASTTQPIDVWATTSLSRSLEAFDRCTSWRTHSDDLPKEMAVTRERLLAADTSLSAPSATSARVQMHFLAHRLLLRTGLEPHQDSRVATALRRLLGLTSQFVTTAGLETLLESLTRAGLQVTGAQRACIVLLKPDGGLEVRVETSAASAETSVRRQNLSHTVIQRVLTSRKPVLVHDVFGDSELMGRPSIASLSLRSVVCVPLVRGPTLYGVMYADNGAVAGSFDGVDLDVLTLFAEQAAAAIETSRLVANVQNSYRELKTMQERLLQGERLRVVGELTSGVAHDFNNLLTAILARLQFMELCDLPPDVRSNLGQIEKAALDAAGVVRRLQGFARAQPHAEVQVVDVGQLCGEVVELLRPLWTTRGLHGKPAISVRVRSVRGLHVRGHPVELREVLTNVLKNALEAVPEGGAVTLTALRDGGHIRVEVVDDGVGISEEDMSRLFVPFFTTKGDRGTGLGLCLAQQIVRRHGGEIRVESQAARGTIVRIDLPVTDQSPTVPSRAPDRVHAAALTPHRVLVIDDDVDVLQILCAYLERSGYRVTGRGSASEGLTAARQNPPDVILSDIAMPEMDGIELCQALKIRLPKVPVVLMSGHASSVDPDRIRRAGAAALLAKPFTMRQVTEVLDSVAHEQPGCR
jgi:signal transduction histidine kinase/ActR/RegA family two-component response regulator